MFSWVCLKDLYWDHCCSYSLLKTDDPVYLSQWLTLNKLKLNVQKTKYMVITFKTNVPVDLLKVRMGDNNLECVKHMKYLEVVIDDKLKFNKNMKMLQKKLAKKSTLSVD
jgi:hypothetical protein